ncbi:carboxypeptidase-like regulatory domain-containing protein [Photobacterium sp. OFAV2-7]|uniref:carboxypeptidase-like regulatory domain-containing protein n=1 Tax=Photobacterium sp. OFAV2-7 TaxID=2917748 RepID=UPI001EF5851F|nr:carboxypeptidase-like regulatory domain-containing protein [Photobacterium sp. OFAV2-7]MCG7587195.1 hypothetical protein [Photobacterium sp. OFAV2-7]
MKVDFRFVKSLLVLLLLGVSQLSYAHQMRVFAYVEGADVIGETYFAGGGKVVNATIELVRDDAVVATVASDSEGSFTFQNVEADSYQIKADGGQGHLASFDIDSSEFPFAEPGNEPSGVAVTSAHQVQTESKSTCNQQSSADLQRAITNAIRPLRTQLEQYEAQTRFRDIAGGIGFIFGFFGLFVLVTRKKA